MLAAIGHCRCPAEVAQVLGLAKRLVAIAVSSPSLVAAFLRPIGRLHLRGGMPLAKRSVFLLNVLYTLVCKSSLPCTSRTGSLLEWSVQVSHCAEAMLCHNFKITTHCTAEQA